jgi:thymidylate kinase
MKTKDLFITINGTIRSGKTTLLKIITEALSTKGFTVLIENEDSDLNKTFTSEINEKRLNNVKEKFPTIPIKINNLISHD